MSVTSMSSSFLRTVSFRVLWVQSRAIGSTSKGCVEKAESGTAAGLFRRSAQVDGVTIVSTPQAAERALSELRRRPDLVHGWDTETAGLQLGQRKRLHSPVSHGYVVCATCFCGEDADFGSGPRLFIDNTGAADGLLAEYFKEYFEDPKYKKVFHNYSFDRHALQRHGIRLGGFHADTLHLARIYDTSRSSWEGALQAKIARTQAESRLKEEDARHESGWSSGGFRSSAIEKGVERGRDSLPSTAIIGVRLGKKPLESKLWLGAQQMHSLAFTGPPQEQVSLPFNLRSLGCGGDEEDVVAAAGQAAWTYKLKNLAAHFGLTDAQGRFPGSFKDCVGLAPTVAAQAAHDSPEDFPSFVKYSTTDAVLTHRLYERLRDELSRRPWESQVFNPPVEVMLRDPNVAKQLAARGSKKTPIKIASRKQTMWDMVDSYVRDLGECLADMEHRGVGVDAERLRKIEKDALQEVESSRENAVRNLETLRAPSGELLNPHAKYINMCSPVQLSVLLFGGTPNKLQSDLVLESTRRVAIPKKQRILEENTSVAGPCELVTIGLTPVDKPTKAGWPSTTQAAISSLLGSAASGGDGPILQQMRAMGFQQEDADKVADAVDCILQMKTSKSSEDVEKYRRRAVDKLQTVRGPNGELLNPYAKYMNMNSTKQLQVLLFGGTPNKQEPASLLPKSRPMEAFLVEKTPDSGQETALGDFELKSLGLSPRGKIKDFTTKGSPSTSSQVISDLVGDAARGGDGPIKKQMRGQGYADEDIDKAVAALESMSRMKQLQSRVTGFATPLLEWGEATGRIHPTWAFDTATGRLVCRTPNLQNLPSAERDTFKVREAFRPREGHRFVIADYSQLELYILAHMSGCPGMIEKLSRGGDYHSEIAVAMFPHIQKAVANGEVVVARDPDKPDVPTVKSKYSNERSQCKALNFGIVYGKTATSLMEDLDITLTEAKELMRKWFDSKPMVEAWLKEFQTRTIRDGCVQSLLGRLRNLPLANSKEMLGAPAKSVRAAQNFGIQGSAADVVHMAMLRLWKHKRLRELGYHMVMQIHDEFVLEGPADGAEEARKIVVEMMEDPFQECNPNFAFKVSLKVDATICDSFGGG